MKFHGSVPFPRVQVEVPTTYPLPKAVTQFTFTTKMWVRSWAVWDEEMINAATLAFIQQVNDGKVVPPDKYMAAWMKVIHGSITKGKDGKYDLATLKVGRRTIEWDIFSCRKFGQVINGLIPFGFDQCSRPVESPFSVPSGPKWRLEGVWVPAPIKTESSKKPYKDWMVEKMLDFNNRNGREPRDDEIAVLSQKYRDTPKKFSTYFFLPTHVKQEDFAEIGLATRMDATLRVLTYYMKDVADKMAEYPQLKQWAETGSQVLDSLEDAVMALTSDVANNSIEKVDLQRAVASSDRPVGSASPVPMYTPLRARAAVPPKPTTGSISQTILGFDLTNIALIALFVLGVALSFVGLLTPLPNANVDIVNSVAGQKNAEILGGIALLGFSIVVGFFRNRGKMKRSSPSVPAVPSAPPQSPSAPQPPAVTG